MGKFAIGMLLGTVLLSGCASQPSDSRATKVVVPNVVGVKTREAKRDLKADGFKIRVTGKSSPYEVAGDLDRALDCVGIPEVVDEQSPDAGLRARPRSTVTIDVRQDC